MAALTADEEAALDAALGGDAEPPRKKKKTKAKKKKAPPGVAGNPLLAAFTKLRAAWPADMERCLSASVASDRRGELWESLVEDGDALRKEYAWAIPDERALAVVTAYGPIVEVGAGKGYWAALLQARGVDVLAYDAKPAPDAFADVRLGGPSAVSRHKDRALFLCYPDDDVRADLSDDDEEEDDDDEEEAPSLALDCLRAYRGDTVVVVGESLVGGGSLLRAAAPWGRSCDSLFQVELAATFHCLLVAALPRWPFSTDCVQVWRRTKSSPEEDAAPGDATWADIPADERIDPDAAAPCARHLLAVPPGA